MDQFIDLSGFGIDSEESWDWVIIPAPLTSGFLTGIALLQLFLQPISIDSEETFGDHSVGNITLYSSIFDPLNPFGVPRIVNVSPVPLVSSLIENQLPAFVQDDHEHFVDFMEAYYEWMEHYRNVQFDIARIKQYQDIDQTVDVFTEQFFREFLVNIPRTMLADKALVLKHVREFYRAKGTEKSYKFFFRILFNINTEFYYPRIDILRVSDGKWIQPKTLRIRSTVGNPFDLVGRKIRGLTNNGSAFVEQVQLVQEGFVTVYELYLNRSSISGIFDAGETVKASSADIEGVISPIVTSIVVTTPGAGYQVGQEILIGGPGVGAHAQVQSVDGDGGILKIKVTAFGAGYETVPLVTCPGYPGVTVVATAEATTGALATYPGFFLNEDGQLSASKYIQDGHYYQQFSYVVFVDESIDRYRDALKRMIHPAGLELFGGFRAQQDVPADVQIPSRFGQNGTDLLRIHEHFKYVWVVFDINNAPLNYFDTESIAIQWLRENGIPYSETVETDYVVLDNTHSVLAVFETEIEAQEWLEDTEIDLLNGPFVIQERQDVHFVSQYLQMRDSRDVTPFYFDPIDARVNLQTEMIFIHEFSEYAQSFKLGPSLRSIERDKFYYKPFERRDITGEMNGVNAGYWGTQGLLPSQIANYQVKDFAYLTCADMMERPWTKINIVPEPILRNSDETGILSEEYFGNTTIIQS